MPVISKQQNYFQMRSMALQWFWLNWNFAIHALMTFCWKLLWKKSMKWNAKSQTLNNSARINTNLYLQTMKMIHKPTKIYKTNQVLSTFVKEEILDGRRGYNCDQHDQKIAIKMTNSNNRTQWTQKRLLFRLVNLIKYHNA